MKLFATTCTLLVLFLLVFFQACGKPKPVAQDDDRTPQVTAQILSLRALSENPTLQLDSLSPYSLHHLINEAYRETREFFDLTPIWESLGIEGDDRAIFKGFIPSYDGWKAAILNINRPRHKYPVTVLRISTLWEDDRRYLFFQGFQDRESMTQQWKYLGNIDFYFDRHLDSADKSYYRIVSDGANTWMVLRNQTDGGTGVLRFNEAWYLIGEKVIKVLDYPTYGYFSNYFVSNRVYKSRVKSKGRIGKAYVVKIQFSVTYDCLARVYRDNYGRDDLAYNPKFTKRQIATYVWNSETRRFVLDGSKSEITEEEIEDVYGNGIMDDEKFMSYNYAELRWIAEAGNKMQKEWLKETLEEMSDSSRKRTLEEYLKGRK